MRYQSQTAATAVRSVGRTMRRALVLTVILLIILPITFAGVLARRALLKEQRFHTIRHVIDCCTKHVEITSGNWPESWTDLERIDSQVDWAFARDICSVDFTTSTQSVARASVDTFSAIYPRKSTFRPNGSITNLINTSAEVSTLTAPTTP